MFIVPAKILTIPKPIRYPLSAHHRRHLKTSLWWKCWLERKLYFTKKKFTNLRSWEDAGESWSKSTSAFFKLRDWLICTSVSFYNQLISREKWNYVKLTLLRKLSLLFVRTRGMRMDSIHPYHPNTYFAMTTFLSFNHFNYNFSFLFYNLYHHIIIKIHLYWQFRNCLVEVSPYLLRWLSWSHLEQLSCSSIKLFPLTLSVISSIQTLAT